MKKITFLTLSLSTFFLGGCSTITYDEYGVPSPIQKSSDAKKYAFFMSINIEDQRVPESYKLESSTQLIGDVSVSGITHGINKAIGARDIVSFSTEFGLSLGRFLFSPTEENRRTQAMVYIPVDDRADVSDAAIKAVEIVQKSLKDSVKATGFNIYGDGFWHGGGIRFGAINLEKPEIGCVKAERSKDQCYLSIYVQERQFPEKTTLAAAWLSKQSTQQMYWPIKHIRIEAKAPESVNLDVQMPKILANLAQNLPSNTWLYVAPYRIDKKWTLPYISDGKKINYFFKPENTKK